jgi:hypothetical protein
MRLFKKKELFDAPIEKRTNQGQVVLYKNLVESGFSSRTGA